MKLQDRTLLDSSSVINQTIQMIFSPLESAEHIHTTVSENGSMEVELPRYRLKFFVNSQGKLESQELSAIIDSDQTCGTFVGLRDKLVICGTGTYSGSLSRRVIVPDGEPIVTRDDEHVNVNVKLGDSKRIKYFEYLIDTKLWRLGGSGSLESNLYMVYLHALTSFVMPDHMTGRTGTEQALYLLRQVHLTEIPTSTESGLLGLIRMLTPGRSFSPKNHRCMQRTSWNDTLSPLSQHGDFEFLSARTYTHPYRIAPFLMGKDYKSTSRSGCHPDLMSRARLRNSFFCAQDSQGRVDYLSKDQAYTPRDRGPLTDAGVDAFQIALLIQEQEWSSKLDLPRDVTNVVLNFGTASGYGRPFNLSLYADLLHVSLKGQWGSLFELCCSSNQSSRFKLMFLFPVLAYGTVPPAGLRILLAIAFSGSFSSYPGPERDYYDFEEGFEPDDSLLSRIKECSTVQPFYRSFKRRRVEVSDRDRELLEKARNQAR